MDMNLKKYDIFSPMVFVLLVIIYLIFSLIGFHYHLKGLIGVDLYTIGIIFLGIIFYIIGIVMTNFIFKNRKISCDTKKLIRFSLKS